MKVAIPLAPSGTYALSANFSVSQLSPLSEKEDFENENVSH